MRMLRCTRIRAVEVLLLYCCNVLARTCPNYYFYSDDETFVKQADSSLLFPLLRKAVERCVSPRVYTIHSFSLLEKFVSPIWRYKDILSRKSSHKNASISVIFWTFLMGKLINCVDPHGNTSSHQALRQQQRKKLWKYMPVRVPLE